MKTNGLVFIHLLKCAGSAFWQAIIQHYKIGDGDYSKTFPMSGRNQISRFNNIEDKSKIEFFYGHAHDEITLNNIDLLLKQTGRNYYLLTVMREPIDRIISTYYYFRLPKCNKTPIHNIVCKYKLQDIYKKGFLENLKDKKAAVSTYNYFFDYQTRLISGANIYINYFPEKYDFLQLDNININLAKSNLLNKFHYIGLQQTIDDDWEFFCDRFNITYPQQYFFQKKNRPSVTDDRPQLKNINQDTINLIKENNMYDIELFDWVVKEGRNIINNKEL